MLKMGINKILSEYEERTEVKYLQLNLGSFKEMRDKLVDACIKEGHHKEKKTIAEICNGYLMMRDGCEINNETFKHAISEIRNSLGNSIKY
jgi:hypothetical protein